MLFIEDYLRHASTLEGMGH